MVDNIKIKVDAQTKDFDSKIEKSTGKVGGLKEASSGLQLPYKQLGIAAGAAFGALATGIGLAVNEAAKFEKIQTQFEVLTGSVDQAKKTVEELQNFAATTPFQFDGIAQTSQQLLGFGFSAEELVPKLQAIGDVAAATGQPINDIGLIFGQVSAAGKLTGERLLQFQERAIPIGPALAKTLGVAESAVKDMVSKGLVDFATFEKAFQSLSQEGGFAFEGMIKQSQTFGGIISTVKDNLSLFTAGIGAELLPVMKILATRFLEFIQGARNSGTALEFVKNSVSLTASAVLGLSERLEVFGIYVQAAMRTEPVQIFLSAMNTMIETIKTGLSELANFIGGIVGTKFNEFIAETKGNDAKLKEDLLATQTKYATLSKEIDNALYAKRDEQRLLDSEKEKEKLEEDKNAKLEGRLLEAEEMAAVDEEIRAKEKEALTAHQTALAEIEKGRIKDIKAAKMANDLEDRKRQVKENNLRLKEEQRYGQNLAAARAFFRSEEVKGTGQMLDNLATLGRSGNKELGRIAKAAAISRAIMNTASGITQALASYPPPLSFAMAASVGLAGAVQIGVISRQKFAKGGLAMGGIPGIDTIPAMLQQGEVVAPRQNFEEVIGSVRAKREAEKIGGGGAVAGGAMEVIIGFTDNAFDIIEEKILENRALGIGAI